MNRLLLVPFVIVVLMAGAAGCSPHKDPALVASLDSMITRTDSLLAAMEVVDMERYASFDSLFRTQRGGIEELLKDTLEREVAFTIGNYYRAMNKSLGRLRREFPSVRLQLERSRQQLEDLRHDIDKGLLPEGPKNTYLEQERLMLQELDRAVNVLMNSRATVDREWEQHGDDVARILAGTATVEAPLP